MKKLLCAMGVAIACFGADAMDPGTHSGADSSGMNERAQLPITDWPRYNPISSPEEMEIYKGTWNSEYTLEQNLSSLLQRFFDTCCVFFGGEGEFVIRSNNGKEVRYNKLSDEEVHENAIKMKEMALDPVGCKLIRLLLTKYESGGRDFKFSKLYVVKGEGKSFFDFFCGRQSDGKTLCVMPVSIHHSSMVSTFACTLQNAVKFLACGSKYVTTTGFPGVTFIERDYEHFEDVSMFTAMLGWLHLVSEIPSASSEDALAKRYKDGEFIAAMKIHDTDFRYAHGVIYDKESGIMMMDSLNISAFMMSRHCVLPAFPSIGVAFDADRIRRYADSELISFYLQGHAKLPQFGTGQYQCSDLDSGNRLSTILYVEILRSKLSTKE